MAVQEPTHVITLAQELNDGIEGLAVRGAKSWRPHTCSPNIMMLRPGQGSRKMWGWTPPA